MIDEMTYQTVTLTVEIFPDDPDRNAAKVTCMEPGVLKALDYDHVVNQTRLELHRAELTTFNTALAVFKYDPVQRWLELQSLSGDEYVGEHYAQTFGLTHENGWVRRKIERKTK